MKLAIMQPYFFPYIGYFDLLYNVDLFVVYDTVQYIRRGWIHRNRVFQQGKIGWQYIIVPTNKVTQRTPINEIQVFQNDDWKYRILGQLQHYEKYAPYALETIEFAKKCLDVNEVSISKLNVNILRQCADLLNISFEYRFCSELNIELDSALSAEEKILYLCEFLRASEYVNLIGGVDLYHEDNFKDRNIKLTFRNPPAWIYRTTPYEFEPNLSIIDVLMWNRPDEIREYLSQYRSRE
jgi:hypothetical protein